MAVRNLSPSPVLGYEHFKSIEAFRPNEVIGGGISVPLDPRNSSAFRAILPFPDCLLVLQRSFARKLQTNMGVDHGLGLMIPISFKATINGSLIDDSTVTMMRGRTPSDAVEEHPNTYLMLRFNSDMTNRGWIAFHSGVRSIPATSNQIETLRTTIVAMFSRAAEVYSLEELGGPMNETLIAGLDTILVEDGVKRARPGTFDKHRRLLGDVDRILELNPAKALLADDLSLLLGVSPRTLQTAAHTVQGMSLHRYLLTKRLWAVHRMLTIRSTSVPIKAIAQSYGFWHMGEFSRSYKAQFSELPSETQHRVRSTARAGLPRINKT